MIQLQGTSTPIPITDINNPEPNSVTVNSPNPPQVPTQSPDMPQGLSAGLQAPGGITVPGSNMTDVAQQANPQHVIGRAFGKVLRGLSGGHNEYDIDPATGRTVSTYVKEPPGSTFKSILALGLMGGQGIGPREGQQTFTQGLLAGLGGGVKESTERSDMLDKQRRAQAQEQYANQLKAAQEDRENKKLTMEQQLNQVAIANHNQEMAIRETTFHEHLADRQAAGFLQSAQTSMLADEPMANGFKSLNIEAVHGDDGKALQNVTQDVIHNHLKNNPGDASKYVTLATGVQQRFDPKTGTTDVQTTYTVYPAMTQVPPTLLDDLQSAIKAEPHNKDLQNMYTSLSVNKGTAPASTIFATYKRLQNWEGIQDKMLDIQEKQTRMTEERANTARSYIEANAAQFNLQKGQEAILAGDLFADHFNNATGALVNMAPLAPVTKEEIASNKWTPAEAMKEDTKRERDRTLLGRVMNAQYQVGLKDYTDHAKVYKDEYNRPITDNPELVLEGTRLSSLAKAQRQLQGGPNAKDDTPDQVVGTVVQGLQQYVGPDRNGFNAQQMLDQINAAASLSTEQKDMAKKQLGLDKGVTQVSLPGGVIIPVATGKLDEYLKNNPGASIAQPNQPFKGEYGYQGR